MTKPIVNIDSKSLLFHKQKGRIRRKFIIPSIYTSTISKLRPLSPDLLPLQVRDYTDNTPIYTFKPPMLSSEDKGPNYLIEERVKEKMKQIPDNGMQKILANISLPMEGTLAQDKGQLFLDISPKFLSYFGQGRIRPVDASIQITLSSETLRREVAEVGQIISFQIKGFYDLGGNYLAIIECPVLNDLREKYLLPRSPGGNPFYLLLGRENKDEQVTSPSHYRVNPAKLLA